MDYQTTAQLFFALAIGLIIGLERGWHSRDEGSEVRVAGIRSFALVGLLGGIAGLAGQHLGPWIAAAVFAGVAALSVAAYWRQTALVSDLGITTELALMAVFGLGVLVVYDYRVEAVATAAVIALLLRLKPFLHQSLQRLNAAEVSATLELLVLAAVVIPLLPNRGVGPWEAINPRVVGLLVLLIAAISYIGYFSIRMLGPRAGILATALCGGLTSSTAVAVAFAQMARRSGAHHGLLGLGIALASATMAPRLLVVVAAVDSSLLKPLALPLLVLGVIPFIAIVPAWFRLRDETADTGQLSLSNPLELKTALIYGVLLTALILAVRASKQYIGDAGVYTLAALSGIADVDAISISLAQAHSDDLATRVVTVGIMIAAVVNTLSKGVISWIIGGWALARWTLAVLGLAALGGGLATLPG